MNLINMINQKTIILQKGERKGPFIKLKCEK